MAHETVIVARDGRVFRGFGIDAYIAARDAGSSEWIVDGPAEVVERMEEYIVAITPKAELAERDAGIVVDKYRGDKDEKIALKAAQEKIALRLRELAFK